jgi:hypothetical protein
MLEDGSFSGYASLYNVVDAYNDVILPGAFGANIDMSSIKLLWQHDPKSPIGVFTKIEETASGLYVEAKILTTIEKGREACELLKVRAIDGLSIGFELEEYFLSGPLRCITKLKLWEISVVTFPANHQARISDMGIEQRFIGSLDRAINILRSV